MITVRIARDFEDDGCKRRLTPANGAAVSYIFKSEIEPNCNLHITKMIRSVASCKNCNLLE